MDKIQRLPEPVSTTQPVGRAHGPQAGKDKNAFREILERKQRGEARGDDEREENPRERDEERRGETEPSTEDAERGSLFDERA